MIIAGIVTYNPDITRLGENVESILPQVDELVLFDNASCNCSEIAALFCNCTILENVGRKNVGIAVALNEICRYSFSKGAEWVLTLDQDSVCPANLIEEYLKHTSDPSIGMLSPVILDRNIGIIDERPSDGITEVDSCITSASLLNLQAWKEVGGFWDDLFIDMVDFDICWSLKEKGYRIIRVNSVSLLHELGHSTAVSFRSKEVAVFNHPPRRYYYIFRNTIAVGRRHHRRYQCLRWNIKRAYLVLRYESDRIKKSLAIARGLFDGFWGIMGK